MQLYAFMITSMVHLIYIGWVRPFKSEGTNLLEMFNEFVVFNCTLINLTIEASREVLNTMEDPYVEGPVMRTILGWVFLFLISVLVLVNAVVMTSQMVYDWKHSPLVKKRRAALARYLQKVMAFDEQKCECACSCCSGNTPKEIEVQPSTFKFEIELIQCKLDNTEQASENKKPKLTLIDKEDGSSGEASTPLADGSLDRISEES